MSFPTRALALCLSPLLLLSCGRPPAPGPLPSPTPAPSVAANPDDAIRHLNVGIAYLEQHKFAQAEQEFLAALAIRHDYVEAHVDLGISLSAQVKYAEAEAALGRALALEPDNPTANYMAGLIYKYKGEKALAITSFEKVRKVDPDDIDSKFNLATLYKDQGRAAEAEPLLEQVIAEAPHFISAYYALGQMLLRQGQEKRDPATVARGKDFIDRFQKLSGGTASETAGLRYGEQGRYGLGLEDRSQRAQGAAPAIRFRDAAADSGLTFRHGGAKASALGSGALVFDLDGDGDDDVVLAGSSDGLAARFYRNEGKGKFSDATDAVGLGGLRGASAGIAAGDIDADGVPDLLVGARLLRGGASGAFVDGTRASGLAGALAGSASMSLVDLDHDGDLDLVASFPGGDGIKAWQNDGAGTFKDVTRAAGLAGRAEALALLFTDFDNDRDIDGLVGVRGAPPRLFSNNRELHFTDVAAAAGLAGSSGPTAGVSAGDFDDDGFPDLLVTHASPEGHVLYRNGRNRKFAPAQTLPARGQAAAVLFLDADLDGDDDLLLADVEGLRYFRNDGGKLDDHSAEVGVDAIKVDLRGLATGDLDGDGDLDLVGNAFGAPALLLLNQGAEGQGWVQIAARGLSSNKSALGTKVELRSARLHHKLEIRGADGFLSQSSPVASFGLAGDTRVDRVRLLWPGGVLQAELELAPGRRHAVEELDRKGSSCPFLWAWDGEKIAFISDIQGGSPLGLWVAPGVRNLPDPDEWFLLPEGLAKPRAGAYELRVTESLEEIAYLDRIMLQVIDAPEGVRPHPNERLLLAPPFAEPGLHLVTATRALVQATDAAGRDVTASLAAIDGDHAGASQRTRFRGFAEPWSLDLDFGSLGEDERRRPVILLAHGYVEFSNSTPMYAAAQAGLHFALPALDLLDASGRVAGTIAAAGAPAGLPKWMVLELGDKLPADGRVRLRYRTNMEVYFDQIQLGFADPEAARVITDLEPASAELRWTGYPTLEPGAREEPPFYRYDSLRPDETWTSQEGSYTRFGDVRALLAGEDDRLVVMSHGDELLLRFPEASLPLLPEGWRRHLVLFSVGYAKDLDLHSAAPLTVGPLPWRKMPAYPYPGAGPFSSAALSETLAQWSTRYIRPVESPLR